MPEREIVANMTEARAVMERWRLDCNHTRPHSAHGGLTPDAVRQRHADAAGRLRDLEGSTARPHKRMHGWCPMA